VVVDGVVDGVVVGMVTVTVDGREVRWVAMEVGLKENGSGVDNDTKAGTDEYFDPPKLLRFGDWTLIIARSDKEFISFLSPLFFQHNYSFIVKRE
jgi:hypothetical protein